MSNVDEFFSAVRQRDADRVATTLIREPMLVHARDSIGATALHYAAEQADRDVVRILVAAGASLNARDDRFHATPAGWAIEYLRELGAVLGIEIEDARFAIDRGDTVWLQRLLHRFPSLTEACDKDGVPLRQRARESKNPEIIAFFA
jgi:ankyrin repeat protein